MTTQRVLGLELAGAKNQKTVIAVLDYYPREQKIFLLDIHDRIGGDKILLRQLKSLATPNVKMGVNVPLELPPCIPCTKKTCPMATRCTVPSVKWMRKLTKKEFTPYTQRPVELWIKYKVLSQLDEKIKFEIDEALGGTKAPLTARMHFLKRHLKGFELFEVWPKLSMTILGETLTIPKRLMSTYRRLEEGAHSRSEILHLLSNRCDLFIYERDFRKLSASLPAFDALICAYTTLLTTLNLTEKRPKLFPKGSGWVEFPKI